MANIKPEQAMTPEEIEAAIQSGIQQREIQQEIAFRMASRDQRLPDPENANNMQVVRTQWIVRTGWVRRRRHTGRAVRSRKVFLVLDWAC